jgi:hypothetical protein
MYNVAASFDGEDTMGTWSKPSHFQHYVIKFDSDLRQVSGFLLVLRFPPPIKLTAML